MSKPCIYQYHVIQYPIKESLAFLLGRTNLNNCCGVIYQLGMGLIWHFFRNSKRKHWFCHLQSFNGQPKLWFSDPKVLVVQLWAGKLELRLSPKIGWVGDSNGWDKLTHIPKPKQYDVKEGIIFRTDEKWTNSHKHISHQQHLPTSLIGYDYNPILGW